MDISIVIRCCNDFKVFDCIQSIDEETEIIVSLCENKIIQERLEKLGIKYCISPKGNLSLTSNNGFVIALHDKVIITDSDTVFTPTCIRQIYEELDKFKVVRAKLVFLEKKEILFSKIVAEARDFVNSLPVVFTPGIGVKKEIVNEIGGFLFNEIVPFAVDADLTFRIKRAKLEFRTINTANIYHVPEKVKHDLRAAFRIGEGCMISAKSLSKFYNIKKSKIFWELKAVKPKHYPNLIRTKGLKVFIYQLLWDIQFFRGAFISKLKN